MKRFVFSALAMLLCVFFLFPAGANEEFGTWGDFSYALYYNGECGLVFYSGKNWKVSVPEEIDGHRVKDIGSDSFWYARFSTLSISFPEGLESVGEKTFRNLYFLTHVTIPVSSIDASLKALSGCRDHLWVTLRSGENAIHTTAGEITRMDGRLKPLFWGSYTADKTYSFDGKFYAVLSTGRMNGSFRDRAKVTIYRTDTNAPVDSFMPVFSEAFRGMCWEKDSYNLWLQASFKADPVWKYMDGSWEQGDGRWVLSNYDQTLPANICYRYHEGTWTEDGDIQCPSYIISRFDEDMMSHPDRWDKIYTSPTTESVAE